MDIKRLIRTTDRIIWGGSSKIVKETAKHKSHAVVELQGVKQGIPGKNTVTQFIEK